MKKTELIKVDGDTLVKTFIKKVLSSFGYGLLPHQMPMNRDFIISRAVMRRSPFYFLQVGANDGVYGDPIHQHIKYFGWHGVAIEPQPHVFKLLESNYKDYPQVKCLNAAIASEICENTLYYVSPDVSGLPEFTKGLATFNRETLLKHAKDTPGLADAIAELKLKCITIQSILDDKLIPRIDLLQIDTEGYDFEVIKSIPFDRCKPLIIQYENKHLSDSDHRMCENLLIDQGYTVVVYDGDSLAHIA